MATDVKINSLDLLNQYQGHFRSFADCVDTGILVYRDRLKKQKEDAQRLKQDVENRAVRTLEKIDEFIRRLEELEYRFDFAPQDTARIDIEKEKFQTRRESLRAKIDSIKEKLDRQISTIDDIWNLTYSYGNRAREMADSVNGSLTNIIATISNYQSK